MSYTGQSKIKHSRNTGRQGADFIWRELRQDNKVKTATVVQQHHLTDLVPTEGCMNIYSRKDKRQPGENYKNIESFVQFYAYTKGISCSSGWFLTSRFLVVKTCRCNFNSCTPDDG
jgi:hypothetical protein